MKYVIMAVVVIVGIFAVIFTVEMSPVQRNLSASANATAAEVLGSNYTQFSGMPELFAYWWLFPIFVIVGLIGVIMYKLYKH